MDSGFRGNDGDSHKGRNTTTATATVIATMNNLERLK